VSIEGLRNYKVYNRRYRNRRIGDFLKELHLTEGRNTGLKKILNALEHNGSPPPLFETDEDRLSFAVTLYQHLEFAEVGASNGVINGVKKPLSENELKILNCMREDPYITKKHISETTGIAARTMDRAISELIKRGVIERQGSRKAGIWVVH